MTALLRIVGALILVGVLAVLGVVFFPLQRTAPSAVLPADFQPAKGAGEQVAIAADCVACHTAPAGKRYGGGRAVDSPFGPIYSTNITPDKESGIGNYTLDDFRAVLYDGVRKVHAPLSGDALSELSQDERTRSAGAVRAFDARRCAGGIRGAQDRAEISLQPTLGHSGVGLGRAARRGLQTVHGQRHARSWRLSRRGACTLRLVSHAAQRVDLCRERLRLAFAGVPDRREPRRVAGSRSARQGQRGATLECRRTGLAAGGRTQ